MSSVLIFVIYIYENIEKLTIFLQFSYWKKIKKGVKLTDKLF